MRLLLYSREDWDDKLWVDDLSAMVSLLLYSRDMVSLLLYSSEDVILRFVDNIRLAILGGGGYVH